MPDWTEVLNELFNEANAGRSKEAKAFDTVRHKYLDQLHNYTKRNIIV